MYVYYRARDMVVKLSLMSWMDGFYLLLTLLYALVKVLEDPLTDFMCLVFTADATVRAGKGPGGSSDGVQNKFELLNIKNCAQKERMTYQHAKVCTEHRSISTSVYIGTCILPEFPV